MKTRKLGNLEVSALGLGCMGFTHAYGTPTSKEEMKQAIEHAIDLGYTFFDTAEVYGSSDDPHANETLLGEILQPYRDKVIIATKFGIHFDETSDKVNKPLVPDASRETILKSVEESLARLQIDCIDLYYQHRQDPNTPVEEVAKVMKELIEAGKIKHWGLSDVDADTIQRAHTICPVTAIQNRYSMMHRDDEELFPLLEELNIGYVAFSPLANGYLTTKYNSNTKFDGNLDYRSVMPQFSKEADEANQELINLLQTMATSKNTTPAVISLAWMMSKKPYIVPIPGTRNLGRMEENASAANIVLSAEEIQHIDTMLDSMEMSPVFGGSKVKK